MKYRKELLKLSLIVGLVGMSGFFGFAAQSPQAGDTKNIDTLMVERRNVLTKLVEVLRARHQMGLINADVVFRAQNELLSAELALAKTREDRLTALKSQLTNYQAMEQRALELQKVGQRGGDTELVLAATAARLQAEIELLRELASHK